jgi:hypothetical protein
MSNKSADWEQNYSEYSVSSIDMYASLLVPQKKPIGIIKGVYQVAWTELAYLRL